MTEEILTMINDSVSTEVFGIWFLVGAAFVFFMQAGFAMVETGFTRAKNAGNIIMKNLMDFCIGTCVFIVIGFGLLLGEDALGGFVGIPTMGIFTDYANFDWSSFVFNLVFCATAATIVSGAMAERTKFLSYCIYSGAISAIVYPIEAHWIWGGGWLAQAGFHDFAGSCAIHMVGGLTALIGAAMVGARIGKFSRDKNNKVTKVHAFPGHNIRGTIAVGLFATDTVPENTIKGLFYGGGFSQLLIQLLGVVTVLAWTGVTMTIVFKLIKVTVGLRVSEAEEIVGLDSKEHGLASAYAGFSIMDVTVLPKVKVEVVVGNIPVDKVIETAKKALYTGHVGDGKIFVYSVEQVVKVRTGEENLEALRDVE